MSGHGLGVFVICPLEACAGSFVCMSGAGTMQKSQYVFAVRTS